MKKVSILGLFILILVSFIACKKNENNSNPALVASQISGIVRGEPVIFTLNGAAAAANVSWTVEPSKNVQITTKEKTASILFGKKGTYRITGTAGNISANRIVTVSDSSANGGGSSGCTSLPFLSGEELKLKPSVFDSTGVSGLVLSSITTKDYSCLGHIILNNLSESSAGYLLKFTGVCKPSNCAQALGPASGQTFVIPVTDGNHNFTIQFNGTTYSGSFNKTGNTYTFTWPYSSGVIISPLTVQL